MRILMLAQFYPPIIGGEERHVRSLSVALAARGHDVTVATLWQEGLAEREIDQGVRVVRIRAAMQRVEGLFSESGRRHAPPFPDPEALWALRAVIAEVQPDVVHAHNWLIRSFLPLKGRGSAPLLLTLHDYSLICPKKRLMYHGGPCSGPAMKCFGCAVDHYGALKGVPTVLVNRMLQPVQRHVVDLFIAVSQAVADGNGLVGSGLPYSVIPNFVPDDVAVPRGDAAEHLAQLPAEPFLLFVGDVGREKGVDALFQAYGQLSSPPPLVLIGRTGADAPATLPPNVTVLHSWPHHAVMEAWRRSHLACAPSIWPDPCPTVVMEAMAAGRPVIGSRIGGICDLIDDGETGYLVPPGDAEALRAAIERSLASPDLVERMGREARRRVVQFQAHTVVPRVEQAYRDVLDGTLGAQHVDTP